MKDADLINLLIEIKVGDKVRIRPWKEIKKTLNKDDDCIICDNLFVDNKNGLSGNYEDMKSQCETIHTISHIDKYQKCIRFNLANNLWMWCKHWVEII